VAGVYEKTLDRESAYEKLKAQAQARLDAADARSGSMLDEAEQIMRGRSAPSSDSRSSADDERPREPVRRTPAASRSDSVFETLAKSAARTIGSTVGREIIRGVLGSILGGSRRR